MENVKIRKVDIKNLKAVKEFTAFFDGKSAHVTGSNGFGKSTIIRALTDRLRGLKPSIITKIGEVSGKTVMELTDGCRFEWDYNNQGKDSLNYFTPDTIKPVRRDVFKGICDQYFPNQFDINKFLTTTEPRKRLQMISELVQVDLTNVQARYKEAFEIRADAKKELKILESQIKPQPETQTFENVNFDVEQKKVEEIEAKIKEQKEDIEKERGELNDLYIKNKNANYLKESENQKDFQIKLDEWLKGEEENELKIIKFNSEQKRLGLDIDENVELLSSVFRACENTFLDQFFDAKEADNFIKEMPRPKELKVFEATQRPSLKVLNLPDPMPLNSALNALKGQLIVTENNLAEAKTILENKKEAASQANSAKMVYDLQLKQYQDFQKEVEDKKNIVSELENDVFEILEEIKAIISNTKLPPEFSIDLTNRNDILFRTSQSAEYLPITNETLASSAIFIAAFKLQANYLNAFKVAHFDVSYLDFENREKVLKEAIKMNIQLITESPAHDEKTRELQYIITED